MKLKDIKLKTCPFCDGEGVLIHPAARKQILKNKIAYLQSELNYFKRRLDEENNNDEKV